MSQSTLKIFRYLYEHLPPLLPEDISLRMKAELESLETQQNIPVEKVEDVMIKFGYEVWPWNQAYKEFLESAENKLGEHFLLPNLNEQLRHKYLEFKEYGGTLRDMHSGRPADFFTSDDRNELCRELINMQNNLRDNVNRDIVGLDKNKYLKKVEDFYNLLEEIRGHIENLRKLAQSEQDHPALVGEINAKIRDFEYSLCLLGPELQYEAVCQAHEFFKGRKQDLSRMRGINIPAQIDWYNN